MDTNECYGEYLHDRKRIHVAQGLDDKTLLITIRHEMMEASLLLSGVGWNDTYQQEAVVRCMEEIFFPAWNVFLHRITKLNRRTFNFYD